MTRAENLAYQKKMYYERKRQTAETEILVAMVKATGKPHVIIRERGKKPKIVRKS